MCSGNNKKVFDTKKELLIPYLFSCVLYTCICSFSERVSNVCLSYILFIVTVMSCCDRYHKRNIRLLENIFHSTENTIDAYFILCWLPQPIAATKKTEKRNKKRNKKGKKKKKKKEKRRILENRQSIKKRNQRHPIKGMGENIKDVICMKKCFEIKVHVRTKDKNWQNPRIKRTMSVYSQMKEDKKWLKLRIPWDTRMTLNAAIASTKYLANDKI